MKLLLVDDEEYVIESIKRNLDLTETGVSGGVHCVFRTAGEEHHGNGGY